jgi:hypothetical protein
MSKSNQLERMPHNSHRFIDEAGDMNFFGKGKINILGTEGVSKAFMLGMVHVKRPLAEVRQLISEFIVSIETDPYFNTVPSIKRRIERGSLYLHANVDPSDLRVKFFDLLRTEIPFHMQVVVGRKETTRFINKHHSNETEFYGDLLAHLLWDKGNHKKLVLNIADLGTVTRIKNLQNALIKATEQHSASKPGTEYNANIVFNPQPYSREPLLAVADYGLWAIQRVFERGETRFYDSIAENIRYITDLYNPDGRKLVYSPRHRLTKENMIFGNK